MPTVSHIFICPERTLPMTMVQSVRAIEGVGLEGDRYAWRAGTFSGKHDKTRHVTLISARDIALSNAELDIPDAPGETRRNLVVEGTIALLDLIGREFTIGDIRLRGGAIIHAQRLAKKPGFARAFAGRAGFRAELLTGGTLAVDDPVLAKRAPDTLTRP